MDVRYSKLATLLLEHSVEIKKGDKIVISCSDLDHPDLINSLIKQINKAGAYFYLDILGWNWILDRSSKYGFSKTFYETASEDQLKYIPEIYKNIVEWGDKFLRLVSLDNYSHLSGINNNLINIRSKAREKWSRMILDKPWILTYLPTNAMSQQAGMSFNDLENFYFKSVLVNYSDMKKKEDKIKNLIDKTDEVRIVGEKTDLHIYKKDRLAKSCYGTHNIPDGEVFFAPEHEKTEGYVYFDLPNYANSVDVKGIYLEFKKGKVVKASAENGEDVLLSKLNIDKGARYLGEMGIGFNMGIQKVMRNTLFDEKIGGTIHLALGMSYKDKEGGNPKNANESAIHWDLVKDKRKSGSEIYVKKNSKWVKVFEKGRFN